ncbi:hypothetical protein EDD37DRAFT_646170 [Exophiala viscosa]|uniref:uncharacterized protein n=1 Tax=Exophiala viscosa TaxID=2486360 RepID=UPI00218E1C5D|nr:hypothetical protein EDD37DRAFT_646170 [Exophiala viscosa]
MATSYNPNISNGTCYYTNGQEAPSEFIPCGNAALGHIPCCEYNDICLSSNACYNAPYGVTYLAGCTDADYEDSACPDKGDFGGKWSLYQTWAGLVYCNGTSNEWVACEDSGSTVSDPSYCYCPSTSRTVAFTDSSSLTDIMSLPITLGSSVSWKDFSAYASAYASAQSLSSAASSSPSLTQLLPSASSTTAGSPSVSPSNQASLVTSTVSVPSPSTSAAAVSTPGLSTGKKVGIAMGAAAAAVILLLSGFLVFRHMRRRQKHEEPRKPPMMDLTRPHSGDDQPDPDMRSPAWSGHKSELAADETTRASPAPLYQAFTERPQSVEVEGKPARLSPARLTQDGGYSLPGQKGTYYEMAG